MAALRNWRKGTGQFVPNNEELDEILVFGYACKIFRDDEKASDIERGKHLIPWNGNTSILIDRYDGRGHLFDLSLYDGANLTDADRELSEDNKQIEAYCDEERYLELHTDASKQAIYEEEEWKRYYEAVSDGYQSVGFSYGNEYDPAEPTEEEPPEPEPAEDDSYIPPSELQLPMDILLPDTMKQHAIIEKTANFIAKHGAQMEIVVKAKQASNEQFHFLQFEDILNPYYKFLVTSIKSGKYKPASTKESKPVNEEEDDDSGHHGYLHPSLMSSNIAPAPQEKSTYIPPKISINDTPYGQLIKSMKKTHDSAHNSPTASFPPTSEVSDDVVHAPSLPPAYKVQSAYGHTLPPPPGVEPVTLPRAEHPQSRHTDAERPITSQELSAYAGSEGSRDTPPLIVPPPPDVQPIIDRMAMYVAKNGEDFEYVVKSKKDPRFEFLHSWHIHFSYYDFKKNLELQEQAPDNETNEPADDDYTNQNASASALQKLSFSIKTKKEQEGIPLENRIAFDYGTSEEETEDSDALQDRSRQVTPDTDGSSARLISVESKGDGKSEKDERIPTEQLVKRQAEERLKDRLAAAARDRLVQTGKEKQLQAERKRKATMFINMLKAVNQAPQSQSADTLDDTTDFVDDMLEASVVSPILRSNSPVQRSKDHGNRRSGAKSRSHHEPKSLSTKHSSSRKSRSPNLISRTVLSPTSKSRHSKSPVSKSRRSRSPGSTSRRLRRSRSPQARMRRSRSPFLNFKRSRSPTGRSKAGRPRSRSPHRRARRSISPQSRIRLSRSPYSRRRQTRSRTPPRKKEPTPPRGYSVARRSLSRSPRHALASRASPIRRRNRSKSPSFRKCSLSPPRNSRSPKKIVSMSSKINRSMSKSPVHQLKSPSRSKRSKTKDSKEITSSSKKRRKSRSKSPSKSHARKRHPRSKSRSPHKSKSSKSSKSRRRCPAPTNTEQPDVTSTVEAAPVATEATDGVSEMLPIVIEETEDQSIDTCISTPTCKQISQNGASEEDRSTSVPLLRLGLSGTDSGKTSPCPPSETKPRPSGTNSGTASPCAPSDTKPKPSQDMLMKVRAMLKASRQVIIKEDRCLDDDM